MSVMRKIYKYPLLVARESASPFKKEAAQRSKNDNPNRIRIFRADSKPMAVVNSEKLLQAMEGNQKVIPEEATMIKRIAMIMAVQSSDRFAFI
jgi:hypothetical protein